MKIKYEKKCIVRYKLEEKITKLRKNKNKIEQKIGRIKRDREYGFY